MPRTRFFRCSCTELRHADRLLIVWTLCCLPYAKLKQNEHWNQSQLALPSTTLQ